MFTRIQAKQLQNLTLLAFDHKHINGLIGTCQGFMRYIYPTGNYRSPTAYITHLGRDCLLRTIPKSIRFFLPYAFEVYQGSFGPKHCRPIHE